MTVKVGGRSYLVGVISFGFRCNEKGFFGVSMAVTHFASWIRSVMRSPADPPGIVTS